MTVKRNIKTKRFICTLLVVILNHTNLVAANTEPIQQCQVPDKKPWLMTNEHSAKTIKAESEQDIAQLIAWQSIKQSKSPCQGFYKKNILQQDAQLKENSLHIKADHSYLVANGCSVLTGNVLAARKGQQLTADLAHLYRNQQTGKMTRIDLFGHIRAYEEDKLLIGDRASFKLQEDTGQIEQALYRIRLNRKQSQFINNTDTGYLYAWGKADRIIQLNNKGHYTLHKATYSTCPPDNVAWQLQANHLMLNKQTGTGLAKDASLRLYNVPIFYSPYYSFPLDNRRKTGLLMPTFGYNDKTGIDISVPYYWNIANNYDVTLTPRIIERGILLAGEFRYLSPRNRGQIDATFFPHDKKFGQFKSDHNLGHSSNNRYTIHLNHTSQLNPQWRANFIYNKISDDYYFQDFNTDLESISEKQFLRQAELKYTGNNWSLLNRIQHYQTLQPFDKSITLNIYSRLPQLLLQSHYPYSPNQIQMQFTGEFTNFRWTGDTYRPEGYRTYLKPELSWPYYTSSGFITPKLHLHHRHYYLDWQYAGLEKSITRTIPTLSLDSSLFFVRKMSWTNNNYRQTLQPRLFYLYTPFIKQSYIPNFDSGYMLFNYDQVFRHNRFSGGDRIGDANQLSLGATTQFYDTKNNQKKLQASIGQIYYFQKRRVKLCNQAALDCIETKELGYSEPGKITSPIASRVQYNFASNIHGIADLVWNPHRKQIDLLSAKLRHQQEENKMLLLNYSFLHNGDTVRVATREKYNNLHQVGVSYAQPLTQHWQGLATWNYNVSKRYSMASYLGLEYNSCCWAVRLLGGRHFNRLDEQDRPTFNKSVYLQILLKGVGTTAVNTPRKIIGRYWPGYRTIFN